MIIGRFRGVCFTKSKNRGKKGRLMRNQTFMALLRLARPRHWVKNVVVFIPVVFSMRILEVRAIIETLLAAAAFCLASSFVYIINDIRDREIDRLHPFKKDRPLAAGRVTVRTAAFASLVFLLFAAGLALAASPLVLAVVAVYVGLQLLYSFDLKRRPLLDVIIIALGFVLRALAGVVAIRGEISPWLFICMFTLWLFMGFCKRYNEVVTIGDRSAAMQHRSTLVDYSPELLTHLITLSAGIAVVGFLLYSLSDMTVRRYGSIFFVYTLPLVIYAIFRFAMLSMQGRFADPTDIILKDRPFQATTLLWILCAVAVIFWGNEFSAWLDRWY